MRSRLFAAAAVLLASFAPDSSAPAQAGQAAAPQLSQAPFRAATTTVEVDVIVRDRNGRFVTGLTPADFEVTEDGAPQRVHSMYLVERRSVTNAAGAGPGAAGAGAPASASPAPASTQRVFVLLFDQEHLDSGGFKRLQDAAVSFLNSEFQAGDVGGILIGGTMLGNRLTTEREVLVQAVRGAKFAQSQAFRKMDLQDWPRITEIEATRIALVNDKAVLDQVVRRATEEAGGSGGGRGAGSQDYESQVRSKASQVVGELRPAAAPVGTGAAPAPGAAAVTALPSTRYIVWTCCGTPSSVTSKSDGVNPVTNRPFLSRTMTSTSIVVVEARNETWGCGT